MGARREPPEICKGLRAASKAKSELAVWLPGAWLCSTALCAGCHTCCLHTTHSSPTSSSSSPTSPWVLGQPPTPNPTHRCPHRAQQGRVPCAPLLSPPSPTGSPCCGPAVPSFPFLPCQYLPVSMKVSTTSWGVSWPKISPQGISGAVMTQWTKGEGGDDAPVPPHCAQHPPDNRGLGRFGATRMNPLDKQVTRRG